LAPVDDLLLSVDHTLELVDEPALPDPGTPTSVTSCGARRHAPRESTREQVELPLPAD
jgi:hypothetical protein